MATVTKSFEKEYSTRSISLIDRYNNLLAKYEFNYFAIISMTITVGSIIGGLTAMYIFENDAPIWQLAICMSASMANNVSAIGQAPYKWMVNIFIITTLLNLSLILINI